MVDETILRQLRDIAIMYPRHAEYVQQGIATIEALQQEVFRLRAAIGWVERPFIDDQTSRDELIKRIQFCVEDADRTALQNGASNGR